MGRVNGLRKLFSAASIKSFIDSKAEEHEQKALQVLFFAGEEFMNKARTNGNYQDQTGNLRSSIGYIVLKDGAIVQQSFLEGKKGSDKKTGVQRGKIFADEVALQFPRGYVLIGVAGMEYAAAVESKGYDVITSSAPEQSDIINLFREINI